MILQSLFVTVNHLKIEWRFCRFSHSITCEVKHCYRVKIINKLLEAFSLNKPWVYSLYSLLSKLFSYPFQTMNIHDSVICFVDYFLCILILEKFMIWFNSCHCHHSSHCFCKLQIVMFQKSHGNRSNEDKDFGYSYNEAWYIYRQDYLLRLLAVSGIYTQ